jgi:hypothetical protein
LKHDHEGYENLVVGCLFFALIWMTWRPDIIRGVQNCRREINRQLNGGG